MSLMTNGSMDSALPAQMARTAAPIRLRLKEGKAKRSEYNFIGYSMAKSLDYINATMRGQAPDRAALPRIQAHFQTRYRLRRTTAPARCLQLNYNNYSSRVTSLNRASTIKAASNPTPRRRDISAKRSGTGRPVKTSSE